MFRPCIDLHEGKVKQIVGGTLGDAGPRTNFVSDRPAAWFAGLYRRDGLAGGHVIMLGPGNESEARAALAAFPGGLHIGGGINSQNARGWLDAGASHVIVTSWVFREGRVDWDRLGELVRTVGKNRLVLDLSCRKKVESRESRVQSPETNCSPRPSTLDSRLLRRDRPLAEIHGGDHQRRKRSKNLPALARNFWCTRWTWKACAGALTANWWKSSASGRRSRPPTRAARIRWRIWRTSRGWAGATDGPDHRLGAGHFRRHRREIR